MSKTKLDEILFNLCDLSYASFTTQEEVNRVADQLDYDRAEAKQAILRWVADEVIGTKRYQEYRLIDTEYASTRKEKVYLSDGISRNKLRKEQLEILARHGYKWGEK